MSLVVSTGFRLSDIIYIPKKIEIIITDKEYNVYMLRFDEINSNDIGVVSNILKNNRNSLSISVSEGDIIIQNKNGCLMYDRSNGSFIEKIEECSMDEHKYFGSYQEMTVRVSKNRELKIYFTEGYDHNIREKVREYFREKIRPINCKRMKVTYKFYLNLENGTISPIIMYPHYYSNYVIKERMYFVNPEFLCEFLYRHIVMREKVSTLDINQFINGYKIENNFYNSMGKFNVSYKLLQSTNDKYGFVFSDSGTSHYNPQVMMDNISVIDVGNVLGVKFNDILYNYKVSLIVINNKLVYLDVTNSSTNLTLITTNDVRRYVNFVSLLTGRRIDINEFLRVFNEERLIKVISMIERTLY